MDFIDKIICSCTTKHPDQRAVPKSWYSVNLKRFACSSDKNLRILAKARKWLVAVLNKFSICLVNESLSYIAKHSSLTSPSSLIINVISLLSMFDPRNIIWKLPGFVTIPLILNQLSIYLRGSLESMLLQIHQNHKLKVSLEEGHEEDNMLWWGPLVH